MILPEIQHASPSFIMSYQIDKDICDKIIKDFESRETKQVYDKLRGYYRVVNSEMDKDIMNRYVANIHNAFEMYKKTYNWSHIMGTSWAFMQPFNIQKYNPGEAYNPTHIEEGGPREGKIQRILAFTTYLNDIEDGGETEFVYQGVKIKPKTGLTLIWPAGWTHPHHGIPAPNETKYIATGWASYNFRNRA